MFPAWSPHELDWVSCTGDTLNFFVFFWNSNRRGILSALLLSAVHFNDIFRSPSHFVFLRVITRMKKKHSLVFCATDLIMPLIKSWLTEGHCGGTGICHCLSAGVWLHVFLLFLWFESIQELAFFLNASDAEVSLEKAACMTAWQTTAPRKPVFTRTFLLPLV